VVATDAVAESASFASIGREILIAGGSRVAVHLRLKRTPARTLYELALSLGSAAHEADGWCVVNGRVDVALCAGSQAVQLGSGALPIPAIRRLAGDGLGIGASVHSPEAAETRVREGADYLIAGSVFATPTHPRAEPAGLGLIASCSRSGAPVIGIGGIGPQSAEAVVRAGASGIAVVRAVWDAPDPVTAVEELVGILPEPGGPEHGLSSGRNVGWSVEGGI
jgi:thiamine-phosphate pyrophosphorylase